MKIVKASNYSAYTSWHYTLNNNNYYFHMSDFINTNGLPDPYTFDTDVIEYIINTVGQAQYVQIVNRSRIIPVNWAQQQTEQFINFIYGTITNAYIATTTAISNYLLEGASIYGWDFEFTGADDQYPGWDTYGTAYGFRFTGICGDKIDLTLDSQGDFYGHNPIGNYQINPDPEPYNWILINQGLDNFYTPTSSVTSFNNLKDPYIEGKSLHFFYTLNSVEHHVLVDDFRDTTIFFDQVYASGNYKRVAIMFANANSIQPNIYVDDVLVTDTGSTTIRIHNQNYNGTLNLFSRLYIPSVTGTPAGSNFGFNLPGYYDFSWLNNGINNYNELGWFNSVPVSGSSNLYLKSFSYTPNTNPNPVPETPIPVTEIPEDPDDPIPTSIPDPVPGITYPIVTPSLPPFASIVSGNDDLWGLTLDFEGAQDGLLPYMNSLSEFQFPSFTNLISDFSGSIIWVAQIMSILYNGTSFNVLFIALCLFSLVSILIGAYKLWATTEPDPNNPGFRRSKRPPRPPKGRRRR